MVNSLPYMQFYPTDYLSDTQHLTTIEHGAYFLLILNYWQRGCPLPDDDRRLAGIAKMSLEQWLNARSTVVEFFCVADGKWTHTRIESDIAKAKSTRKQQSEAGKRSAAKRLKKRKNLTVVETPFNGRSTDDERTFIYTDTDTDTDYSFQSSIGNHGIR
jgi:uncharacterized protein YdaU (DUF1376 family)